MQARMVGARGVLAGETQPLAKDRACVVGRSDQVELPLLDGKVSREHCRFLFDGGFFVVEDMGSRNGTWVNGKRVTRAILFHGDRVLIGDQEFRFELEDDRADDTSGLDLQADAGANAYATEIKEPSRFILLSEADTQDPDQAAWTGGRISMGAITRDGSDTPPGNAPIDGRHNGFANVLFADMSIGVLEVAPDRPTSPIKNVNANTPLWTLPAD